MQVFQSSQDPRTDQETLRQYLENRIFAGTGSGSAIVHIQRSSCENSTSFLTEILTLQFATGEKLNIFLKDFGFSRLPKDNLSQRRERELRVYRDILQKTDVDTAKYYGAIWDEVQHRFWLLLEWVDGIELRSREFDDWVRAAGWLGRMQGAFAQYTADLNICDFLVNHNANFFWLKAEQALAALAQISPSFASRLTNILNHYDRPVAVMVNQPRTLVHGSYRPQNILVNPNVEPVRICPIDWELAALGAPLYDLAFLSDGFHSPRLDRLWEAYQQQATESGVSVPDQAEMRYVVDCFRLHKLVKSLSESVSWQFPEQTVAKLVGMAEEVSQALA